MNRTEAREKATALVAQMTIEEAASQLLHSSPAIPRLGIPAYDWWSEALHGVARAGTATCYPQAIGLGATFDRELLQKIAGSIALEARAKYNAYSRLGDRTRYKGVTMWSPNINIFRDPRWGRGQETYGEDPVLTASLGCAFVEGLQTKRDGYLTTAACAKHFAVHSGPEALRHSFDAKATKKDLWETYLPAFEALVTQADVEAVMGAYNRTNEEPCCAHSYLMEEVLRDKWQMCIRDRGITSQPDPEKKPDFLAGLMAMRKMHIRAIKETGLTAADEMLYPENWGYVSDILSYVAIGARSVEDQQHRLTVSGFDVAAGMKNPTSGDFSVMLNSVYAAQHPHSFISVSYTHLDVYKRQLWKLPQGFPDGYHWSRTETGDRWGWCSCWR